MRRSIWIIGYIEKFDKRLSVQHLDIQTHTAQPGGNRIEALIEYMPSPCKCVLAQADFSCRAEHFLDLMEKSPLTVTQRVIWHHDKEFFIHNVSHLHKLSDKLPIIGDLELKQIICLLLFHFIEACNI